MSPGSDQTKEKHMAGAEWLLKFFVGMLGGIALHEALWWVDRYIERWIRNDP
jgi:hypothetical protein